MTARALSHANRQARPAVSHSAVAAVMVALVVVFTFGAIASLRMHIGYLVFAAGGWLLIAFLSPLASRVVRAQRHAVISAWAWAATMAGVVIVEIPGPGGIPMKGHSGFGEHPVIWLVGAPWPGVEGSHHGWAHERIPFDMGIDALLVNYAFWFALFTWLHRKSCLPAARGRTSALELVPVAAIFASICTMFALVQLVYLFD